ncbi:unnamed protein product, partial [Brassica oleracea]
SVDAKNQNEPSETKPPIIHNLSHHFSFGKHLMVANAGDGRAVLCRNRHVSRPQTNLLT